MLKVKFVDMPSEAIKNKTMSILRKHFDDVVECDNPDYLFYSVFGYEHLKYDCVRIEWLGENLRPDFNICAIISSDCFITDGTALPCPVSCAAFD